MSGPRVGIDGLALRTGGGVTWLVRLVPALATVWPEASIEVLIRSEVTLPVGVGSDVARVKWTPLRVPTGAFRLPVEKWIVSRFVRRAAIDVLLAGADAGPARLSCPFVQASLNAKPYTNDGRRYRWLRRAASATARGAYATAFLSDSLRRLAEPILKPRRCVVIPAGVDLPPVELPTRLLSDPYVLVVATGYAHKDLPTALEAVLSVRRSGRAQRLVWVGAAVDADVVATLRRISAGDPAAWVEVGAVDQPTLEAWYAHADAVMLPSLLESGGLPVAEALARGIPVVASDIPAIAETAAGSARLHPPGDVAMATKCLSDVLDLPPRHADRRAAGRDWAFTRTWAATARAYRRVLEDALADAPRLTQSERPDS